MITMRVNSVRRINSFSEACRLLSRSATDLRKGFGDIKEAGKVTLLSGKETGYGNFLKGIFQIVFNPNVRFEVLEPIWNSLIYRVIDKAKPFNAYSGSPQLLTLAQLVERGPLKRHKLKILDAGCNHGYLVNYINQPIERYIGLDIIEETIDQARKNAKIRFEKKECSNYQFTLGDILSRHTYAGLPTDNNLVVCTGTAGHFRPRQIALLLNYLNEVLSDEDEARIYLGYPVINDRFDRKLSKGTDDGIDFTKCYSFGALTFRCYDPDQFEKFVESLGFEIDFDNSDTVRPNGNRGERLYKWERSNIRTLHLCLKKKSTKI